MPAFDTLIYGYKTLMQSGVARDQRNTLNFINCRVTDNPTQNRTDVTALGDISVGDWQESVRVATSGPLPAYTSNVNELRADVDGVLVVDGVSVVNGDRVLVKDEWMPPEMKHNGIYEVTSAGSLSSPWILNRAMGSDVTGDVTCMQTVPVCEGVVNALTFWTLTSQDPITLNTTPLVYQQLIGSGGGGGGTGGVPTRLNKLMIPLDTANLNYQPTGLVVADVPTGGSNVAVIVNTGTVPVGDGVRTEYCYFSADGGATARTMDQVTIGDEMYWNSLIAGYQLEGTVVPPDVPDLVSFDFDVGGTTGGASMIVPNIAALSALTDGPMVDGTIVSMVSLHDLWQLDRSSALAPDGITVLATFSGVGRWIRMCVTSMKWKLQDAWYLDEAGGSDEASGSIGSPVAHWDEIERRVGPWFDSSVYTVTVHVLSDITTPLVVRTSIPGFNAGLWFVGSQTVLYSGSVSNVVPYFPPTLGEFTDATLPVSWTASGLVKKCIVITAGAVPGAIGWCATDLGAKTCRFGPFADPATFVVLDPTLGDTFDVVDITQITGAVTIRNRSNVLFQGFDFAYPGGADMAINVTGTNAFLIGCKLSGATATMDTGQLDFLGCYIVPSTGLVAGNEGSLYVEGCLVEGTRITWDTGCTGAVYQGTLFNGPGLTGITVNAGGSFWVPIWSGVAAEGINDPTGNLVYVGAGGTARWDGVLFGVTNTFMSPLNIGAAGTLVAPAVPSFYSLGISTSDLTIGGLPASYAMIPLHNLTNGAVYAVSI